jgi:hypothetical protein
LGVPLFHEECLSRRSLRSFVRAVSTRPAADLMHCAMKHGM